MIALLACTFGPAPGTCTADDQCRTAFGFGWTCGAEGYCEEAVVNPRCASSYPEDLLTRPELYGDALVVADLFQTQFDGPMIRSAELAVREAVEEGGLDGRPIAVLHCDNDDRPDLDTIPYPDATWVLAQHVVGDLGVEAIVGPASSDAAKGTYETVEPLGAVTISPSASSPVLTTLDGDSHTDDDPGLLWRTVPPDDLQATAMVDDLLDRGVGSLFVIAQVGTYGTALADAVVAAYPGTVAREDFENENERNAAVASASTTDATTEVVFISSAVDDVVRFLNSAAEVPELAGRGILLADAAADPYLLANVSDAAVTALFPTIRGTRPQIPDGPVTSLFRIAYSAAFEGEDPSVSVYAPYTYDATWLALYGAAWATVTEGGVTGLGIARGMRRTVDPEATATTPIQASSWTVVVEAFRAGGRVDLDGASGALDFDPVTGEVSNPIEVWVISDDDFVADRICEPGVPCRDL